MIATTPWKIGARTDMVTPKVLMPITVGWETVGFATATAWSRICGAAMAIRAHSGAQFQGVGTAPERATAVTVMITAMSSWPDQAGCGIGRRAATSVRMAQAMKEHALRRYRALDHPEWSPPEMP